MTKEADRECVFCGVDKHTRPYGPDEAYVCVACRQAIPGLEEICERNFKRRLQKCGDCVIMTPDGPIPGKFGSKT